MNGASPIKLNQGTMATQQKNQLHIYLEETKY